MGKFKVYQVDAWADSSEIIDGEEVIHWSSNQEFYIDSVELEDTSEGAILERFILPEYVNEYQVRDDLNVITIERKDNGKPVLILYFEEPIGIREIV